MIARLLSRIRALPAWLTRNGGYWGGITMWDRNRHKR